MVITQFPGNRNGKDAGASAQYAAAGSASLTACALVLEESMNERAVRFVCYLMQYELDVLDAEHPERASIATVSGNGVPPGSLEVDLRTGRFTDIASGETRSLHEQLALALEMTPTRALLIVAIVTPLSLL
jgi:hypothetical protein